MRYVIVDSEAGKIEIATITNNPKEYISTFEPIDAVNGLMFAWDEDGNLYHFGSHNQPSEIKPNKLFQTVNVGNWDFDRGDPQLIKVKDAQEDELKHALLTRLVSIGQTEASINDLPISALITKVSATLKK